MGSEKPEKEKKPKFLKAIWQRIIWAPQLVWKCVTAPVKKLLGK